MTSRMERPRRETSVTMRISSSCTGVLGFLRPTGEHSIMSGGMPLTFPLCCFDQIAGSPRGHPSLKQFKVGLLLQVFDVSFDQGWQ